ncbi:DUF2171 domain-containing protein [Sphingomonas sp. NPDC019816]|uniref:DUF2171 domain-containing protein n=1 Tax=Sphingomonas sp. NPDC019816 TaxID=3390679 RepID=UPI003CFD6836
MAYDRYSRGANRGERDFDYGRDYGSGRDYTYSSARDYDAAGAYDNDRDDQRYGGRNDYGSRDDDRRGYGARDYGHQGYGNRDSFNSGRHDFGGRYNEGRYGEGRSGGYSSYRNDRDYGRDRGYDRDDNRGSAYGNSARGYGYTGDRYGRDDRQDRDYGRQGQNRGYGRQPQGYDYEDRGFFARAGDEVRSWFGDEEAERRREADARYDERYYAEQDHNYNDWRSGQIAALDRDYDEYRSENRAKFHNEFNSWRTERQGQRDLLSKVKEHQEVVGSDGSHVGTVDKMRGDRILLTKNDRDAGGQHHSIPSRWLKSVDDKVTLTKTAEEAKAQWREEENARAMFGDRTNEGGNRYGQTGNYGQSGNATQTGSSGTTGATGTSSTAGSATTGTTNTTGTATTSAAGGTSDTNRGY